MNRPGALQTEIQQRRPFRSVSQEAALGVLRTADILRRHFDEALKHSGLTQQQYNVLRILRGAGDEGLATLTIAERMVERAPGITRLIDRLLNKGLVSRERAACDRRQVVCRILPAGIEQLKKLEKPMNVADDASLAMLEISDQKHLIELLDRIRRGYAGS